MKIMDVPEELGQEKLKLKEIAKGIQTEEECLAAVRKNVWVFTLVPEDLRTESVSLEVIQPPNAGVLPYVSKVWWQSANFCLEAVRKDANALPYVSKILWQDRGFCLEMVSLAFLGETASDITVREINPMDFNLNDISCSGEIEVQNIDILQYIPEAFWQDAGFCLESVCREGRVLQCVPEPLRTPELCRLAVQQNGWALAHVPIGLRTPELCRLAVKNSSSNDIAHKSVSGVFPFVPEVLWQDADFCLEMLQNDNSLFRNSAIQYVPEALRTLELCIAAVKRGGDSAIQYVPKDLQEQVWEAAGFNDESDEDEFDADYFDDDD